MTVSVMVSFTPGPPGLVRTTSQLNGDPCAEVAYVRREQPDVAPEWAVLRLNGPGQPLIDLGHVRIYCRAFADDRVELTVELDTGGASGASASAALAA